MVSDNREALYFFSVNDEQGEYSDYRYNLSKYIESKRCAVPRPRFQFRRVNWLLRAEALRFVSFPGEKEAGFVSQGE